MLATAIGAMLVLFYYNQYPSQVFVGDTLCFWAGGAMVAAAFLSGSGLALLMLMAPQLFNFLYSLPQLFGLIPCPRHRLPKYIKEEDRL
jgi:UDP-N-acetylglucosamine--dolichyl-phosphate N-acetylglucosaminephosphotransferase